MYLDNITNKYYPVFFVLMRNKDTNTYLGIFKSIYKYITNNYINYEFNLKSFCTDFEEAIFTAFKKIFNNNIEHPFHHSGCLLHYLQSNRRKLQELHLTKKIYKEIYDDLMNKFLNYSFTKNKSLKIEKELTGLEKKYKLDNKISNYYIDQWFKFLDNNTISYLNVQKIRRTNNTIEIFNRYFHKKCN